MPRLLQLQNIQIQRDNFSLGPFSKTFEWGGLHLIRGPNGSGKTSLLKTIFGRLQPLEGTILERPQTFGVVGLEGFLYETWSVQENFCFLRSFLKSPKTLPSEISPWAERRLDHLSAGQRRQVELALTLELPFEGVLLDEPLNPLDERAKKYWADKIHQALAPHRIIFITTHMPQELAQKPTSETILNEASV